MEPAELRDSVLLHAGEGLWEESVTQGDWKLKLMVIKLERRFLI